MTFEDLRNLYAAWSDIRWDRYNKAVHFTRRFHNEFVEFLGAPRIYEDLGGESKEYIRLVRIKPLNEELKYTIDKSTASLNGFDGHISEEEEEGLVFGINIIVDREANSWPKESIMFFRFAFRPRPGTFTLYVFRTAFEVDMELPQTWRPVFEFMKDSLVRTLNTFEPPAGEKLQRYVVGFIRQEPYLD